MVEFVTCVARLIFEKSQMTLISTLTKKQYVPVGKGLVLTEYVTGPLLSRAGSFSTLFQLYHCATQVNQSFSQSRFCCFWYNDNRSIWVLNRPQVVMQDRQLKVTYATQ